MKPIITVEIDAQGNTKIEVSDVAGPKCHELTKDLEKALGKVTDVQNKPELRQLGTESSQQKIGGA